MSNPFDSNGFSTSDGGFDNGEAPNDWGNGSWETQNNQDDWEQGGDDWETQGNQDDWGAPNTQSQGNWAPQDLDPYGYDNSNGGNFGMAQSKFNTAGVPQEDFDNKYEKQFNVSNPVADRVLSMKTILSVLLIGIVILIGIFVLLNRVHISKKVNEVAEKVVDAEVAVTSPETGQTPQDALKGVITGENDTTEQPVQQTDVSTQLSQPVDGSALLMPIDSNTPIDYSVPLLEASGIVSGKRRYLQGSQLVYCLDITIAVGSTQQTVCYYCNYASFNAVKGKEVVLVKYQQVSDSFISISEITK